MIEDIIGVLFIVLALASIIGFMSRQIEMSGTEIDLTYKGEDDEELQENYIKTNESPL